MTGLSCGSRGVSDFNFANAGTGGGAARPGGLAGVESAAAWRPGLAGAAGAFASLSAANPLPPQQASRQAESQ